MAVFNFFVVVFPLLSLFFNTHLHADTVRFTSINYCPFSCIPSEEDGKEGIMVEVVRAALEEQGHDIDIAIMPYARAVKAANSELYDGTIVVGKIYAPELIYPEKPTLTQRMLFMVKPSHNWRFSDYDSLLAVKLTMQIVKGFDYADDNINRYVSTKPSNLVPLHGLNAIQRGLELLHLGRVDSYAEGELTAQYNIDKYGYKQKFIVAGYSQRTFESFTAFNPNSANAYQYAQLISKKINALKKNGELAIILKKYGIAAKQGTGKPIGIKRNSL